MSPRLGLAALLLCAPNLAWAADECGPAVSGVITCDPNAPYKQGIAYRNEVGSPVEDLTLVAGPGLSVSATDDAASGISITNQTGAVTITIPGSNVSTSGALAAGVRATDESALNGDITIVAGDVSTTGDRADGIFASTNYGGKGAIAISAVSVSTAGEGATGIRAEATDGAISIKAASILTSGYGSDGATAFSYNGDVALDVGAIQTSGTAGRGIVAYSGGTTTVIAGSVTTTGDGLGQDADAGGIKAVGAAVHVTAENVSTSGAYSVGIYANSNLVHVNGQAETDISVVAGTVGTTGFGSDAIHALNVLSDGDVTVNAGTLTTSGEAAWGVYAFAVDGDTNVNVGTITTGGAHGNGIIAASIYGDTNVKVGSITTSGPYSGAIYAYSGEGNVKVDAGKVVSYGALYQPAINALAVKGDVTVNVADVSSYGTSSPGIVATAGAKASVTAGYVQVFGDDSPGILARGSIADVTVTGDVAIQGNGSYGVVALASKGDAKIDLQGNLFTQGNGGVGVLGVSQDGNVGINVATVTTVGPNSTGVKGIAYGGSVNIAAGKIETLGANSGGILAIAQPGLVDEGVAHDVTVTADSVSTNGVGTQASGIVALNALAGGNATIAIGSVATRRDYAMGAYAFAQDGLAKITVSDAATRGYGAVGVFANGSSAAVNASGAISTVGDFAAGIKGYASTGGVAVASSGSIQTSGRNGYGVVASGFGHMAITNTGSVATSGEFGHGLYAISSHSEDTRATIENSGSVTTKGDGAAAIRAIALSGSVMVTSTGSVSAEGDGSAGIVAAADRAGRGDEIDPAVRADVTVKAASVVTTGKGSTAVLGINYAGGDVLLDVASVVASGEKSRGMFVVSGQKAVVDVGKLTATERGILMVSGYGSTVNVSGAVTTPNQVAIELNSAFGDSTLNIAKTATVTGGGIGDPNDEAYTGIGNTVVISAGGHSVVNNAGVIRSTGNIFTILVAESLSAEFGDATINNSGQITGSVRLTSHDDLMTNTGTFEANRNSDFGDGADLFINAGLVRVRSGAGSPGAVTFAGLERFENRGGTIDMRNGSAGDVFTVPGTYVGSSNAKLGLDVALGSATSSDTFVIQGAATGHTSILLANVGAAQATLTAKPITLVKVGSGSEANAFALDPSSTAIGFIQYGLSFDGTTGSYGLVGVAGAPVHRLARTSEAAQNIWLRSADAVADHATAMRDRGWSNPSSSRLWGQSQGGVDTRRGAGAIASTNGSTVPYDSSYRQDYYGVQLGFDLLHDANDKGGVAFGLTGGYISSKMRQSADRLSFDAVNGGAYVNFGAGGFFASALAKYDRYWVNASSNQLGYDDRLRGSSWGASGQAGYHLDSGGFFAEPVASVAWTQTNMGDLHAWTQTIDFDRANGLRGKAGMRIGTKLRLNGGDAGLIYASGHAVHEFKGTDGLTLKSGSASEHVGNERLGTYGEGTLGVSVMTAGAVSGYIEGVAHVGASYRGAGGRVGLQVKF